MRISRITTGVLVATLAGLLFVISPGLLQAQTNISDREQRRAELEAELESVQEEIDAQETKLNSKRQERQSLERDVEILEAEINKAELEIQQNDIRINELTGEIQEREDHIESLNNEIERKKESLAELLRRKAALDNVSLVEMALSNESLSEFFSDINVVQSINDSMQTQFTQIRDSRAEAEEEQEALASQRDQVTDTRQEIASQKQEVEQKEAEREQLAAVARSEEQSYESVLEQKEARAAEIRSELFALRDVEAIPFGTALQHAREVSRDTDVRPAFLLAILQQESNLGQNVGTCNRPQDPPSKQWDQIMKPSRDIPPYKRIVSGLGIEPTTRPLSCPYGNGWGGAMGPAQFIPSTWETYQNRIANALGVSTPNPWNPRHAFMASGIYLADLGAGAGGYTAERRAALKYYSGSNWQSPGVQFYGDQVLQRAEDIQQNMIDPLDEVR